MSTVFPMRAPSGMWLLFLFVLLPAPAAFGSGPRLERELTTLDASNPSVSQAVDAVADKSENRKFVHVEVAEVVNPRRTALIFKVYFQPDAKDREKIYLGSFSLFPADNPGKFIVSTQGKVQSKGALILSMEAIENGKPDPEVRVRVEKMRLVKGS